MSTSFRSISFRLCFQFNLILNVCAEKPRLQELIQNSESAHWPLQGGYPGLTIENLNEYVSLFSHCLVNIQNYQGIEIIGIKSPVRIVRFDVAYLDRCWGHNNADHVNVTSRFFFGKIPKKSGQKCTTDYDRVLKYSDKSFTSRWYCRAEFDLFFPEPMDAPHIVYHSQIHNFDFKRDLFDVSLKYTYVDIRVPYRDNWSKILLT